MTSNAGSYGILDFDPADEPSAYDWSWRKLRRWVLRKHIAENGWFCPGFMVPPHPSRDLEGHHRIPVSQGGESTVENTAIYCSSCHGRLHAFRRHPLPKRCPIGRECYRPP